LLASAGNDKTIKLWEMTETPQFVETCFFNPAATSKNTQANTYRVTDAAGITRTYTLPCGSPIPAGAVCTCNCIPGAYAPTPTRKPSGGGGFICTCDKICTCIPVRKYCFVMFK